MSQNCFGCGESAPKLVRYWNGNGYCPNCLGHSSGDEWDKFYAEGLEGDLSNWRDFPRNTRHMVPLNCFLGMMLLVFLWCFFANSEQSLRIDQLFFVGIPLIAMFGLSAYFIQGVHEKPIVGNHPNVAVRDGKLFVTIFHPPKTFNEWLIVTNIGPKEIVEVNFGDVEFSWGNLNRDIVFRPLKLRSPNNVLLVTVKNQELFDKIENVLAKSRFRAISSLWATKYWSRENWRKNPVFACCTNSAQFDSWKQFFALSKIECPVLD
jgi:hypothetical protein